MHYRSDDHGLPHDPFKAIVAPRPIGWLSTVDKEGRINLAPYSFFNAISSRPNLVAFSSAGLKHSASNVRDTGEFVFNLATMPLAEQMNATSAALEAGENEFAFADLAMVPSDLVAPPRVAAAPAALECKLVTFMELTDIDGRPIDHYLAIGQVVATYIDDACITDGRFDTVKARVIARCGYMDYAVVDERFEMARPTLPGER